MLPAADHNRGAAPYEVGCTKSTVAWPIDLPLFRNRSELAGFTH